MIPPIVVGAHPKRNESAPLELGAQLASMTDAPLHVIGSYWFDTTPRRTASEDYCGALRHEVRRVLERLGPGRAEDANVDVSAGSAAHALKEHAAKLGAGLIVVGSTKRSGLGRMAMGSTAAKVLDGAPCPIAIAPQGFRWNESGLGKIGVAFVDTEGGRAALEAGAAVARRTGASLIGYTVIDGHAHEEDRRRAERALQEAIGVYAGELDCTARMVRGGVEALIAESGELDMLIRGCRGRGALRAPLARDVPTKLAGDVHCPFVVVPPKRQDAFLAMFGANSSTTQETVLLA